MKLTKLNKERVSRLQVAVIDCDYKIKRFERENNQAQLSNWIAYRDDLKNLINTIKSNNSLSI